MDDTDDATEGTRLDVVVDGMYASWSAAALTAPASSYSPARVSSDELRGLRDELATDDDDEAYDE